MGSALIFGGLSFEFVEFINSFIAINLFLKFGFALLLYGGFTGMMIWWMPGVAGTSREEIKRFVFQFIKLPRT